MRGSDACVQRRFGRRRAAIFVAVLTVPRPARTCEPGPRMCRNHGRDARLAPASPRGSPPHHRAGPPPPRRTRRSGLVAPSGRGGGPARGVRIAQAGPAGRVWYSSGSPRSRRSSLSDDRRGGPRSPGVPTPSGPVAQLAEQQTLNLLVEGSTPSRLTNFSLRSSWFRPGGPQPQGSGPSDLALEVDSPDGSLTRLAFGSPRCAFRFAQVGFARRSSAIAGRA